MLALRRAGHIVLPCLAVLGGANGYKVFLARATQSALFNLAWCAIQLQQPVTETDRLRTGLYHCKVSKY